MLNPANSDCQDPSQILLLLLYATHNHYSYAGIASGSSPVGSHMALKHHLLVSLKGN